MHVLNILSSHYDKSFNAVLTGVFNGGLRSNDHTNETIDLYEINFNPVMHGDDFNQFTEGSLPQEIIDFQDKILISDVITFFYPVWWCDMPAIMKGWIDRVFAKGFAYEIEDGIPKGRLQGKKIILISTFGNAGDSDEAKKLEEAIKYKFDYGVFNFCGITDITHHFLYEVYSSDQKRAEYLKLMETIAAEL